MSRPLWAAGVLMASSALSPALAQSSPQVIELPEVSVTAPSADAPWAPPPLKQKYDLPQTSQSITSGDIAKQVNAVDAEDSVKYFPSLFVRKRNYGDTQPTLATRTWGVNSSARSLVYEDDVLLSALLANNNTLGAPRWGMITPEEIERVDFLYGPFAAQYPGNSVGGVLIFTTKMPDKFEFNAKQTEALQTFSRYNTSGDYATSQTNVSSGDRMGNFSYVISGNYQNSYSQPLSWITTPTVPAGTSGTIPSLNKLGQPANVVGAGGLLHTEMENVSGKFAWDITDWLKAKYEVALWANDAQSSVQTYLRNAAGFQTFAGLSGFASSNYTVSQQHLMNAVSLKTDTGGAWDWDLAVSRYDFLQDTQASPFGVTSLTNFTTNGKVASLAGTNWMNGDIKAIWRAGGDHEVSFGIHADRYSLDNPTYAVPGWNSGQTSSSQLYTESLGQTQTQALWAQDAWKYAPDMTLTLGGRLENWRASDGFNLGTTTNSLGAITSTTIVNQPEQEALRFSPKASWQWRPQDYTITASFGQAYRFPTVTELYQIVQSGSVYAVPNPNLVPEDVLSEEIAIEKDIGNGRVRLSFFNEHVEDALIQQTSFAPNLSVPVNSVVNVQAVRNTGVELAINKRDVFVSGLELFGSVTYVDSRILADPSYTAATGVNIVGNHVPYVPDWRATLGGTYSPDAHWSYTVAARYSGKQYSTLENNDVIPNVYGAFDSFFVVDVRARYKFNDSATISVGVDNLNNDSYTLFHPFPQRTFVADAKIKF